MELIIGYLVIINILAFGLSGYDKSAAIHKKRRIPEKTLFFIAIMGGSIGLYISMSFFRHKTKHLSFTIGVPIIILVQAVLVWLYFNGII